MNHENHADPRTNLVKGKILSGRILPEFFPLDPEDTVLNVGCGSGPQAVVYRNSFRKMVGIDINFERLCRARSVSAYYRIENFNVVRGNVEMLPFRKEYFDKAILLDIIEHVQRPEHLLEEAYRILKPGGMMLVTFPAMHDKFVHLVSRIAVRLGRKPKGNILSPRESWNPDAHRYDYPLQKWLSLVESKDFTLVSSRASTLFPPLHRYGIPRFWFSNNLIHAVDAFFCRRPILQNMGQALVCIFRRGK